MPKRLSSSSKAVSIDTLESESASKPRSASDWIELAKHLPTANQAAQSKASPELIAALLQAMEHGTPQRFACKARGITEQCLENWKREDPELCTLIEKARATGVESRVIRLNTHEDWKATAWLLARDVSTREDFRPSEHGPSGRQHVSISFGFGRNVIDNSVLEHEPVVHGALEHDEAIGELNSPMRMVGDD